MSNFRGFRNVQAILLDGYSKLGVPIFSESVFLLSLAQYKDRIFQFTRADCDVLVFPRKYVNELRAISNEVASPTVAHAHNLMGGHTNMNIILKNNFHFRTLQLKLTFNLINLSESMQEELNHVIEKKLSECSNKYLVRQF